MPMPTCLVCALVFSDPAPLASLGDPERRRNLRLRNHKRTGNNQRANEPSGEGSPIMIQCSRARRAGRVLISTPQRVRTGENAEEIVLPRGKRGEIATLDGLRSPDRRETQVERAVFERIVVVGERSAQVSRKRISRERVVACTLHRNAASMTVSLRCGCEPRARGLPMSSRREERKHPDEQERNDSHFRNHPLCLARSVGDHS